MMRIQAASQASKQASEQVGWTSTCCSRAAGWSPCTAVPLRCCGCWAAATCDCDTAQQAFVVHCIDAIHEIMIWNSADTLNNWWTLPLLATLTND